MQNAPATQRIIRHEDIVSAGPAVEHLQRRDVSAEQLHYSLQKYTGDPVEITKFGAFLGRWPMYSEGLGHREAKRSIMACMAAARELVPALRAQFRNRLASSEALRDDDLIALSDMWQSTVMGMDPADYDRIAPLLDTVTSYFTTRSATFDFASLNVAVNDLRYVVENYPFCRGSLLASGRARGLHGDVLINLLADPRPSMLHCMRVLIHERGCGARDRQEEASGKRIVEDLLRTRPPFGSIHRIVERPGRGIEKAIRVDIHRCNAQITTGFGLTFGFGRHACPAANLISDSLVQLWIALVEAWPASPVSYCWQGVPCDRSNPLRDQRMVFCTAI